MTDDDRGSRADDWLFSKPRDPDEQPRDIVLDRVIKHRRRKEANWASLILWSKRIGAGLVVGAFVWQFAEPWIGKYFP